MQAKNKNSITERENEEKNCTMMTPVPSPWAGSVKHQVALSLGIAHPEPCSPMCYCPNDPDKTMTVYKHAVEGLETKFKGFGDTKYSLKSFSAVFLHHLEEWGLDGVFMLMDAQTNIHNMITQHALFPLAKIKMQTATFQDPSDWIGLNHF